MSQEAVIEALMGVIALAQLGLWLRFEHRMTQVEERLGHHLEEDHGRAARHIYRRA